LGELPENGDNPAARWRRWAGDFRVQLAAAYAVVAIEAAVNFLIIRPGDGGRTWFTPMYAYWDPAVSWRLLPGGVAAAGAVLLLLYGARRAKPWVLGAGAALGITCVNLASAYNRDLPFRWVPRFLEDARYIYQLPNIFSSYPGLAKFVHIRCRTRPGVTYWLLGALDRLFEGNIYVIAFFFIIAAALSVPILYYAGRAIFNKDRAPWVAVLFAAAPALIIFGSEVDGFYCLVATAVLALGIKAVTAPRPWPWAIAAGAALAVALTTSYVQAIMIPLVAVFVVAAALTGRSRGRPLVCGLIIIATAVVALGAFQLATGYEHFEVFKKAYRTNQQFPAAGENAFRFAARKLGFAPEQPIFRGHRSYPIFAFGNLYAIFLFMGIPTAVLYGRGLFRAVTRAEVRRTFYGFITIGFAVLFLAFNFSGLILGEVERIWLFLIPMFAITAGQELATLRRSTPGAKLAGLILGLSIVQALVYNMFIRSKF
jgi:4-amino-4-deoxy-L-arabinose transferase-like glycosyltransferase